MGKNSFTWLGRVTVAIYLLAEFLAPREWPKYADDIRMVAGGIFVLFVVLFLEGIGESLQQLEDDMKELKSALKILES